MNKVFEIGNLANDPELRKTYGDVPVCTFRIAVQRTHKNSQGVREADFFNIVTWRQTAELCAKYLAKGRKVAIAGSLQNRTFDAQDGTKRYVTEIIADSVEFLTPRGEGGSAVQPGSATSGEVVEAAAGEFSEVQDDEPPF